MNMAYIFASLLLGGGGSGGSGLTNDIKQALLQIAEKAVYVDAGGATYYQDLFDALYPTSDLVSISAVFTQGQTVVYDTDSLDSLKSMLVVTATYSGDATATVPSGSYTLSGTLTAGTSTITVSYGGKTDTFTVTVTAAATQYTITNSLTNCTSSNNAEYIAEGDSYSATLTPTSGYQFSSVSVTMGGTDITSTAYSNGVITIASVTGNLVITAAAVYAPSMVTDGLVTYFDCRTCAYDNAGSGSTTKIYSSDDDYSTFTWGANSISSQSATLGFKFANTRKHTIASSLNGTTAALTNSTWTMVFQCYKALPTMPNSAMNFNNSVGLELAAPYTNTSDSRTKTSYTGVDIGYRSDNEMFMPLILRASVDKFEVFDKTGTVVYTKNSSDIADFASWITEPGFGSVSQPDGMGFTFFALYNKALSDAQVLDMVEYVNAMEVSA